jgi:hypothetical protein
MRSSLLPCSLALLASVALGMAAGDPATSVLNAIKQLPKGEAKKIAVIEARDGTPYPERWHILVNDPKDENGLHEYVVAGGEVVASRNISQFAESLKPTDVVGAASVRVDSDKLANLATLFAQANSVNIASINYSLKKEGTDAVPLWNVTCLDEAGKELGHIVVSAGKGTIVSHEGFTAEPGAGIDTLVDNDDDHRHYHKPVSRKPAATPEQKKDVMSKIGNSLSKFFGGSAH